MSPAKSTNKKPRYRILADQLIAQIRQGALKIGERLPGEIELTSRFSVSGHTVRDA